MKNHRMNRRSITVLVLILLTVVLACGLLLQTDYVKSQLDDFGLTDRYHTTNRTTVSSWNSCLKKLNIDADVVFFGDSITTRYDFQAAFPEKKVVNLGLSGDSILDMIQRVYMIETVSPEKIFLLAGINSLKNETKVEKYYNQYVDLCEKIREVSPSSDLYIISVLPVSSDHDNRFLGNMRGVNNSFIVKFNTMIHQYADQNGFTYVDIYPYYEKDGSLNPDYSEDGLHITDEAYCFWIDAIREYIND